MAKLVNDYYMKLKINDLEFEVSTTDYDVFDSKSKEFLDMILNNKSKEPRKKANNIPVQATLSPQHDGFIEVKDTIKLNELEEQPLDDKQQEHEAFENALQKAIEKDEDNFNVNVSKDKELETLFNLHNPTTEMQIMLLSAAYLLEMQNQTSFSLKQINARFFPIKNMVITHAIAQEALENGYIVVVPDLTKTSDVTEYNLTEAGEDYLRHELG